ncbi:MAG TPA: SOS response-associated peptidase family protein, partial [Paraburkholderia sp.]
PTARYFEELWKTGRVLVPADGWFEWRVETAPATGSPDDPVHADAKDRQPYFVHLKNDAPMYLAALSSVRGAEAQTEGMGLVIVTASADAGLIDVHDRRPLAFAADAARRWLDPALPPGELEQLARSACLPAARFRWHRVSHEVNRTLNDEPRLIEALH